MHKLSFVCFVFLLLGFTVYCLSSNACARRTSITPKRNGSTRADVSWATDTHTRHLFIDDLHRLKACSRQANYVSHHIVIILLAHETRRLYCRISELILINSSEIITLSFYYYLAGLSWPIVRTIYSGDVFFFFFFVTWAQISVSFQCLRWNNHDKIVSASSIIV